MTGSEEKERKIEERNNTKKREERRKEKKEMEETGKGSQIKGGQKRGTGGDEKGDYKEERKREIMDMEKKNI